MDNDRLIGLFLEASALKRMPRTGWLLRGVPHVESVADHSYSAALVALALADILCAGGGPECEIDLERVLLIALLHDLAEVRLTDLPLAALRLIPPQVMLESRLKAQQLVEQDHPVSWLAGLVAQG